MAPTRDDPDHRLPPVELGEDCGPHCGYQYGRAHHCPCSEQCHGVAAGLDLLDRIDALLEDGPTPPAVRA